MKKTVAALITTAAVASAAPASAVTYVLTNGAPQNAAVVTPGTLNVGGLGLTGFRYTVAPTALNSTSQLTQSVLSRTSRGVGACTEGVSNGGQCPQVDTDGPQNEVVRAAFGSALRISRLVLTNVDNSSSGSNLPDSLRLFGASGNGTALNLIGYGSTIVQLALASGGSYTGANGGTAVINFTNGPKYERFYFTSNNNSADGYSISSITAVPEPATWAMLVLGFGIVGAAMRRRGQTRTTRVTA